jgi:hypothetical protein
MEKLAEIKALKALMNDDTYLKDSISIESFEEMVLNIQNDHPIFLNTPHDGERQASLIKKVEELEAMLKEKNETLPLADDERDCLLAKYWNEFSCPAAAEMADIEKDMILGKDVRL